MVLARRGSNTETEQLVEGSCEQFRDCTFGEPPIHGVLELTRRAPRGSGQRDGHGGVGAQRVQYADDGRRLARPGPTRDDTRHVGQCGADGLLLLLVRFGARGQCSFGNCLDGGQLFSLHQGGTHLLFGAPEARQIEAVVVEHERSAVPDES